MKKISKFLTVTALVSMLLSIIIVILSIFGLKVFKKGPILYTLLSLATISTASFFINSALMIFNKKRFIAITTIFLIIVTSVFGFIIYWSGFETPVLFNKITGIVAIATVFTLIIVTTNIKVENHYLVLQIITYLSIIVIDICLTLIILGINILKNDAVSKGFITLCLISLALLLTIRIIGRKEINNSLNDDAYIKIKKSEYDYLLQRIKELENN